MQILAGNSDFKKLREQGYYYIDKSMLVAEVLRSGSMVMQITRPRRFGKTLNLSMLEAFFQCGVDHRHLFAGLAIEGDADALTHLGAYPTVSLSFKDLDCLSWADWEIKLKGLFSALYFKHKAWIDQANPQYTELRDVSDILAGTGPLVIYENALKLMTSLIQRATGKQVMLLIDEYDTPINAGQLHHYYDQVVGFIRNLLRAGLKDNTALERGVLTGVLRVAKESIFSGLNNIQSYSMLNEIFSTQFGFCEHEVLKVLEDFKLCPLKAEVTAWYNGYRIGNQWIYNPWSIMNLASSGGKLDTYWINTSTNEMIRKLLTWDRSLANGDLACLLQGRTIRREISETVTLRDLHPNDVWSLLFYSGYLTFLEPSTTGSYELGIPNLEVRRFFEDTVKRWLGQAHQWDGIQEALAREDMPALERHLGEYFKKTLSFYDLAGPDATQNQASGRRPAVTSEAIYHAVFLGMLMYHQGQFDVTSNRESGYGRYDILLTPKRADRTGYLFELKQTTPAKLATEAERALQQIEQQQYASSVADAAQMQRLMLVGIASSGKRLALAHRVLDLTAKPGSVAAGQGALETRKRHLVEQIQTLQRMKQQPVLAAEDMLASEIRFLEAMLLALKGH